MHDDLIPPEAQIYGWIEEVVAQGVRRPGHPADRWAEGWIADVLAALGLERVRHEPVELASWEPRAAELAVSSDGVHWESIACFALPHSTPAAVEAPLVVLDQADPSRVRGGVALRDVALMRVPQAAMAGLATWAYDPDETFASSMQVLPFGREFMTVMDPASAAGAAGFVGVLADYPGDSKDYYVPYDAVARPIPGVWVCGSDGRRLHGMLARGAVRAPVRRRVPSPRTCGHRRRCLPPAPAR